MAVLLGTDDGRFRKATVVARRTDSSSLAVDDLDGDGRLDLAFTVPGSHAVAVLLGTGRGRFATARIRPVGFRSFSVAIADLDGDGVPDLAVAVVARARHGHGRVSVLRGRGDGSFEAVGVCRTGVAPAALAIGDLNGDGRPDLAVADEGSDDVSVLLSRRAR